MGYQTEYRLSILNSKDESDYDRVDRSIQTVFPDMDYTCQEWAYCGSWEGQDQDMCDISTDNPDLIFELKASGDYAEDVWVEYWQNGYVQHCDMIIPPYDPNKMQKYSGNEE